MTDSDLVQGENTIEANENKRKLMPIAKTAKRAISTTRIFTSGKIVKGRPTTCLLPRQISLLSFPFIIFLFYSFHQTFVSYVNATSTTAGNSSSASPLTGKQKTIVSKSRAIKEKFGSLLQPYTSINFIDSKMASPKYYEAKFESELLKEGIKFFVDDYERYHKKNRYNGSRYLIYYAQGAGGLGDRCNLMMVAYWLSVLSNRVFLVDWQEPFPIETFLSNKRNSMNMFYDENTDFQHNITARVSTNTDDVKFLNATDKNLTSFANDESLLLSDAKTIVFKKNRLPPSYSDKFLSFSKPHHLPIATMHHMRNNGILRRIVFHHIFKLSTYITIHHTSTIFKLNLRSIVSRRLDTKYIAVHARIGKGVNETANRFNTVIAAQRKVARCLASRAITIGKFSAGQGKKSLPIFLATDTPEFRSLFNETVRNMTNGRVKVITGDWNVVHTKTLYSSISRTFTEQTVLNSLLDLTILGHAQHIIALYSSFPRLAQWIGDAETLTELRNDLCLTDARWD